MSKMYEAIQYAYAEKQLKSQDGSTPILFKKQGSDKTTNLHSPILRSIPKTIPRVHRELESQRMGSEMIQLKQWIETLLPDPSRNILQFISAHRKEGTSTILGEFAKVLESQYNKSVLLMDVDGQNLDQHDAFGIQPKRSLGSIVKEGGNIESAFTLVKNSKISLCILSDMHHQSFNSSGLLKEAHFIWEHIRKQFDFILIDSPPSQTSIDGLAISSTVDGVIIVVEAEKSRSPVIQSLKSKIVKSGGNILGIVFNKQRYYIPPSIYKML